METSEKHEEHKIGCNAEKWGHSRWNSIHAMTIGYSENPSPEEMNAIKQEITGLKYTLPCSICRGHFEKNYKELPLTDDILKSRKKLIEWGINFHNIINKMLGKPIKKMGNMRLLQELMSGCYLSECSEKLKHRILDKVVKKNKCIYDAENIYMTNDDNTITEKKITQFLIFILSNY